MAIKKLTLDWRKCKGDPPHWCPFDNVGLTMTAQGIYGIWHEGSQTYNSEFIYFGQGDVAARIEAHRRNASITAYRSRGKLRVSWATVAKEHRDGVERFLIEKWNPPENEQIPTATPIEVNSP